MAFLDKKHLMGFRLVEDMGDDLLLDAILDAKVGNKGDSGNTNSGEMGDDGGNTN